LTDGPGNLCRNPSKKSNGAKTIWCYTTDSKKRWEYCDPMPSDDAKTEPVKCFHMLTGLGKNRAAKGGAGERFRDAVCYVRS